MRSGDLVIIVFLLLCNFEVSAYGVLTHEAIIDASWDKSIAPVLMKKYPAATADELVKAHAYAYGGAIMPDMGYFPFGIIFFTDLVHYVRSGDFVMNLLSESRDINELAFALGALAHYTSDKDGHPGAVNLCVSMVYPEVQREFGDTVSFAEDPVAHRRMEFGFDVLQVARGKYAPKAYHDFIGFEVALPLLERAFQLTYGLKLNDIYSDLPLAINTFRWSVKTFLPEVTKVAWISRKKEIEKSQPGMTQRQFNYGLNREKYEKEWGTNYHKPGVATWAIATVTRLFPKLWLARILKFKAPTVEAEALFVKSFDHTLTDYAFMLKTYETKPLRLANIDFDTGKKAEPCEYILVDEAYKKLAIKLSLQADAQVSDPLRKNILYFFKTIPPNLKSDKELQEYTFAIAWLKSGK